MTHLNLHATSVLLLSAALAFTGCAKRERQAQVAAEAGIFLFGNGAEPQDLDPQVVTGIPEHKISMALFEGLVIEDPKTLDPIPGVASSWDISPDGLVYTFHLRPDARWSNGDTITATDFVLSYKRMLTPSLAAEYANMIYDFVENAKEYYDGTITDFSQVGFKAVDDRTLEVRLRHPTPYLLRLIASHYSWHPVPVKVIEKFGGLERKGTAWTRPENFVGNGPFILKSWRPQQVLTVERNPHYWDAANVKLNEVHFVVTENIPAEERSFRAGQLHRTQEIPTEKIDVYRQQNSHNLHIDPYLGVYFYRINVTRPPFTDVRVRRAFALAVNRDELIRTVVKGGQTPAYNFTPPGFASFRPKVELTGTIDDARALLAEAGFPEGRGMPVVEVLYNTSENHRAIAEALQSMWRTNLGVDVKLKNEEWKVYLDSQDNLNYSLSRSGWIADYVDPHTFLEIFVTGGGNNDTGWSSREYDTLRERALAAKSDEERFHYYERMEEILVDELPIIPLYHYTRPYLLDTSVKGWHPNVLDNHPFKFIWLEPEQASDAGP